MPATKPRCSKGHWCLRNSVPPTLASATREADLSVQVGLFAFGPETVYSVIAVIVAVPDVPVLVV